MVSVYRSRGSAIINISGEMVLFFIPDFGGVVYRGSWGIWHAVFWYHVQETWLNQGGTGKLIILQKFSNLRRKEIIEH